MKYIVKFLFYFLCFTLFRYIFNSRNEIEVYFAPFLMTISIYIVEKITRKTEPYSFYSIFIVFFLIIIIDSFIMGEIGIIYSLFLFNIPLYMLSYPIYNYSVRQYNLKKLIIVIGCVLFMFSVNYFFRDKINDYQNYGSLKKLDSIKLDSIGIINKYGENVKISFNNQDKILVKFWNYSCPICIAEAPILDSFYLANNKLKIMSIYLMSRDSVKEFNRFLEIKSTVNSYFLANSSEMNALEVTKFPTYIIFLRGKPIFKGNLENAMRIMKE